MHELPVWRSMLFVPANVERYFHKAGSCGADAIIFDLEDSVAPSEKESARTLAADAAEGLRRCSSDLLVRINRPLDLAVRDIEAVVSPRINALMLPKVESASHVRLLAEVVTKQEDKIGLAIGHTKFFVVVETVQAFTQVHSIAAAHPRIVAFSCGTEDFAASMGAIPDSEVLRYPKQQGVIAARAAGVLPVGLLTSIADYQDTHAFRAAIQSARKFGVEGSPCIHPVQVPLLNEGFAPTEVEIRQAEQQIQAYEDACRRGRGVISIDGKMVDAPIVERSRRVLRVAERIAACG